MAADHETLLIDRVAYDFQIALTDAIALYVRELENTQFRALTYRGAYLGRAIATDLYFRLVNDDALRSAYTRAMAGEVLSENPNAIPLSTVAYWVFRQILGRRPGFSRGSLRDYRELSLWMGRRHLKAGADRIGAEQNRPVLILALSKRFFDYLLPIRRALGANVVWLVPAQEAWTDGIVAAGEKIVTFDGAPGWQPIGALTSPLGTHWSELGARFDEFRAILEIVKPSAVVVTEGNQATDEIIARAAQSAGVRSICVQQGWSPIVHAGFRNMCYDAFCAWGSEFVRLLRPHNRRQHFAVTGSHQVGPAGTAPDSDGAITFFLQKHSLMLTPLAWTEMLALACWVAQAWPRRRVLVRAHPAERLTEDEMALLARWPNIALCPPSAVSLGDMLKQTAIAIAFYSTTLVEALTCEAVPLIVNVTGMPRYSPDLEALGVGVEVHDFAAARIALTQLLEGEDTPLRRRIPSISRRFFAYPVETALRHIAAAITSGR